jgi:hypothetical protein
VAKLKVQSTVEFCKFLFRWLGIPYDLQSNCQVIHSFRCTVVCKFTFNNRLEIKWRKITRIKKKKQDKMRDKKSELYLRCCGCAGEREKNRGISTDTLT